MSLAATTLFILPAVIIAACYIIIVLTIWRKGQELGSAAEKAKLPAGRYRAACAAIVSVVRRAGFWVCRVYSSGVEHYSIVMKKSEVKFLAAARCFLDRIMHCIVFHQWRSIRTISLRQSSFCLADNHYRIKRTATGATIFKFSNSLRSNQNCRSLKAITAEQRPTMRSVPSKTRLERLSRGTLGLGYAIGTVSLARVEGRSAHGPRPSRQRRERRTEPDAAPPVSPRRR